ncbi:MAG: pentapeptide repeat-containing protein [Calditrichia bacterium]
MANKEHLAILEEGVHSWNKWRLANAEVRPILSRTRLKAGDFRGIDFRNTDLTDTDLSGSDIRNSDLRGVILSNADLSSANLGNVNLNNTILVRTNLTGADLSGASVCGLGLEQVALDNVREHSLVVSYRNEPYIAVDGLTFSQFVHRIVHDDDAGVLVNGYREKAVLLVGAFTESRRTIRKAVSQKLREQGYLPVVFDYETLNAPGVLEKMHSLAAICRFIVADVTGTATLLSELREFVPSLNAVSVQPIAYSQEVDPSGFSKYEALDWMLPLHLYDSLEEWEDLGDAGPDDEGNPQLIPQVEEADIVEDEFTPFVAVGENDIAELAKTYEDFLDSVSVETDDTELADVMRVLSEPLVETSPTTPLLEEQADDIAVDDDDIEIPEDVTIDSDNGVYEIHDEYHEAELNGSLTNDAVASEDDVSDVDEVTEDSEAGAIDWPDGTTKADADDEELLVDSETILLDPDRATEASLVEDIKDEDYPEQDLTIPELATPTAEDLDKIEKPESEDFTGEEATLLPDSTETTIVILPSSEEDIVEEALEDALDDVAELEGEATMVNLESPAHFDSEVVTEEEVDEEARDHLVDVDEDEWSQHQEAEEEQDEWPSHPALTTEEETPETLVTVVGERERRRPQQPTGVPMSLMLKRAAVIVGFLALIGAGYWYWLGMHRDIIVNVPTMAKAHVFIDGEKAVVVGEQAGKQAFRLEDNMIGKKEIVVYPTQLEDMDGLEFVRYKTQSLNVELGRGEGAFSIDVPMELLYSVRKVTKGKYPNISPDGSRIAYVKPVEEWTKKIWFKDVYIHNLQSNRKLRITKKNEFFYDWDRPYLLGNNKHAYLTAYNSGGQYQYFFEVGGDSLQRLSLPVKKSRFGFLPLANKSGVISNNKVYDHNGRFLRTLFEKDPFNNLLFYAGNSGVMFFEEEKTKRKRTLRLNCMYVDVNTKESRKLFTIFKNNPPFLSASNGGEKVVISDYTGLNIGFMTTIKLWQDGESVDLMTPLQDGSGKYKDGTTFHKTEACATSDGNKIVFEYDGEIYLIEIPTEVTMQDLKNAQMKS